MFIKQDLVNMLVDQEGLKLKPYKDTKGIMTIGIGRNLDNVGITQNEAYYLCDNDIDTKINELRTNLDYFDNLPAKVQMGLTNLCFNMGIGTLLTFHQTLGFIEIGDFENASIHLLQSQWAKDVGPTRALTVSNLIKNV